MLNLLAKAGSRFFGALTGAVTGIISGFFHANAFWGSFGETSDAELRDIVAMVTILFYLPTLPLFMAYRVITGAYEGLTKGFIAGLTYPATIYNQLAAEEEAFQKTPEYLNHESIYQLVDRLTNHPDSSIFLSYKELKQWEQSAKSDEDKAKYDLYKSELDKLVCPITNLPVYKLERPIILRKDNETIVCEGKALKEKIEKCSMYGDPVNFRESRHPNIHEIIRKEHVVDDMNTKNAWDFLPKPITSFINFVRQNFRGTTASISKPLGVDLEKAAQPTPIPVIQRATNPEANERKVGDVKEVVSERKLTLA